MKSISPDPLVISISYFLDDNDKCSILIENFVYP